MQVCDAMYFCSPRCESRDVRALDGTETSDLCSAMCIAETTFAMRCIFIVICTLTVEIHCDVGRDGSIVARAMPRCGFRWSRMSGSRTSGSSGPSLGVQALSGLRKRGVGFKGGSRHNRNCHNRRNRQNRQNRHGCLIVLYFVGQAKGG